MTETEHKLTFRWYRYTLPNGRHVYLTNRPDSVSDNTVQEFIETEKPGVRFQFTDDMVAPPVGGPPWHWYPWVPMKNPPLENIFAYITHMDFYNKDMPVDRPAWLHCDSSSMRAPTYFSLYLHAVYPKDIEQITATLTANGKHWDLGIAEHAKIEYRQQPETEKLVEHWVRNGQDAAYHYYMGQEYLIRMGESK